MRNMDIVTRLAYFIAEVVKSLFIALAVYLSSPSTFWSVFIAALFVPIGISLVLQLAGVRRNENP